MHVHIILYGRGIVCHPYSWSEIALVAVESHTLVVRAPAAKARVPGFDSQWLPCFFFSSSWLANVDGMKDLLCFSSLLLLTDINGKIYGALVQFSCYQHRYEWKGLKLGTQ